MDDISIMIVDDEEAILEGIKDTLPEYPISTFCNPLAAESALGDFFYDIIVADYKMPHLSGLEFFIRAKQMEAYHYGILLTAYADKELLRTFINHNLIQKVIEKPLKIDLFRDVLNEGVFHCIERKESEKEILALKNKYESMLKKSWFLNDTIIGINGGLKGVFEQATTMASTDENLLITGETGTGKEVFARAIHSMGARRDQPFVKINCGAIPETLIEDELFGHVRGAYSGAYTEKKGKIELADRGTLFLDEIGELRPDLQTRLLQVVQEKRIERIGGTEGIDIDFRLLSATNRDIDSLIRTKQFREDLFFRIATYHLRIPSLRERKEDIPLLIQYLLDKYREEFGRKEISIGYQAMEKLLLYEWPGNIRELESVLKRAVSLLNRGQAQIAERDIALMVPLGKSAEGDDAVEILADEIMREKTDIREIENRILKRLLAKFDGKVYEAAKSTGIPKDRFYRNVK